MSEQSTMEALARLVPHGSRVLDLGCGNGAMLSYLQRERGCTGYGVEIDDANVLACVQRGVDVIQLNLDEGLAMFGDNSFDVVLQIDTLQHLRNAEVMLRETARVGRTGVVAFPNFVQAVLITQGAQDVRLAPGQGWQAVLQVASLVSVPVRMGARAVGVLEVVNRRSGKPFSNWDVLELASLSNQFGLAIDNLRRRPVGEEA